jgi:hypothetical protein
VPINFTVLRGWFAFVRKFRFTALVFYGEQEKDASRNRQAQIAGMAKAELSYDNLEEERAHF